VQSAQAISAAYYFDLAARDYILADGAIELVIEGVPCSALIEPSQSSELIFCARSDRLRGTSNLGGLFFSIDRRVWRPFAQRPLHCDYAHNWVFDKPARATRHATKS
jgi:hypothetical protein